MKIDLVLNNLQMLICYKNPQNKQNHLSSMTKNLRLKLVRKTSEKEDNNRWNILRIY